MVCHFTTEPTLRFLRANSAGAWALLVVPCLVGRQIPVTHSEGCYLLLCSRFVRGVLFSIFRCGLWFFVRVHLVAAESVLCTCAWLPGAEPGPRPRAGCVGSEVCLLSTAATQHFLPPHVCGSVWWTASHCSHGHKARVCCLSAF